MDNGGLVNSTSFCHDFLIMSELDDKFILEISKKLKKEYERLIKSYKAVKRSDSDLEAKTADYMHNLRSSLIEEYEYRLSLLEKLMGCLH